jgi:uncharacterized protein (DUF433 family)
VASGLLYFNKGIYSVPDAARLTAIDVRSISRWAKGYHYPLRGRVRERPPVFRADFERLAGRYALSFLDLMELRFVKVLREHGLSFHKVRSAANRAAEMLNTHHPFASYRFFTDRKTIFLRIAKEQNDPELLDIVKRQYGIERIISPLLLDDVEFAEDFPSRWYPAGKGRGVIMDPGFSFGQPIVAQCHIRTSVLYASFLAEGSIEKAAKWYEVDSSAVKQAVDFESRLAS